MSQQNPSEVSQQWLAWLGQQTDAGMAYVTSLTTRGLSLEELQGAVATLDQYEQAFEGATGAASWLTEQGLPQFAQQLDFAIRDVRTARNSYYEMVDAALREAAARQQQWIEAHQFATINLIDSTRYSQAAFQRSLQGILDVQEQNCFVCHKYIGVVGGGYCAEHARMRGLPGLSFTNQDPLVAWR
jgi:hypothetical protein